MTRSNAAFHGVSYDYSNLGDLHYLEAQSNGQKVGALNWEHDTGKITGIHVSPEYRRKGVGTGLYNEAMRISKTTDGVPTPRITSDRTNDGEEWAKSLGKRIPKRKS